MSSHREVINQLYDKLSELDEMIRGLREELTLADTEPKRNMLSSIDRADVIRLHDNLCATYERTRVQIERMEEAG